MDINNIYKLLDRYMEGENTQDELHELERFFLESENIPEDLLPYKEMFEVLDTPLPSPSDEELKMFCEVNDIQPVSPTTDKLPEEQKVVELKPKIVWWKYAGVAAAIALIVVAITLFMSRGQEEKPQIAEKDKPQIEKKAMPETKQDSTMQNAARDIERLIHKTPRHEMAKADTPKQQKTVTHAAAQDNSEEEEENDAPLHCDNMEQLLADMQMRREMMERYNASSMESDIRRDGEAFCNAVNQEIPIAIGY